MKEQKSVPGNVDCFEKKLWEDRKRRRELSEALVKEMEEARCQEEARRKSFEKAEDERRQARDKIIATMTPVQRLIYDEIQGLASRLDELEDQIMSVGNDVEELKGTAA